MEDSSYPDAPLSSRKSFLPVVIKLYNVSLGSQKTPLCNLTQAKIRTIILFWGFVCTFCTLFKLYICSFIYIYIYIRAVKVNVLITHEHNVLLMPIIFLTRD